MSFERGLIPYEVSTLEVPEPEVGVTQYVTPEGYLFFQATPSCIAYEPGLEWSVYPPVDLTLEYWSCYAPPGSAASVVVSYEVNDRYAAHDGVDAFLPGSFEAGVTQTVLQEGIDALEAAIVCAGYDQGTEWPLYPPANITLEYWTCYSPPCPILVSYGEVSDRYAQQTGLEFFETGLFQAALLQEVFVEEHSSLEGPQLCVEIPQETDWPYYPPKNIVVDYYVCYAPPGPASNIVVDYGDPYSRFVESSSSSSMLELPQPLVGNSVYVTPEGEDFLAAEHKSCVSDGSEEAGFTIYPPPYPIVLEYFSCYEPPLPIVVSYDTNIEIFSFHGEDFPAFGSPFVGYPGDRWLVLDEGLLASSYSVPGVAKPALIFVEEVDLFEGSEPALYNSTNRTLPPIGGEDYLEAPSFVYYITDEEGNLPETQQATTFDVRTWEPGDHFVQNSLDVLMSLVFFAEQKSTFKTSEDIEVENVTRRVLVNPWVGTTGIGEFEVYFPEPVIVGDDDLFRHGLEEVDEDIEFATTISLFRRFVGFGEQVGYFASEEHALVFDQHVEVPWLVPTRYETPGVVRHLEIAPEGHTHTQIGDITSGFGNVAVTKGVDTLLTDGHGVRRHLLYIKQPTWASMFEPSLITQIWNQDQHLLHLDGNAGEPYDEIGERVLVLNVNREIRLPGNPSLRTGDLFDTVGRSGHPVHVPGESTLSPGELMVADAVRYFDIPAISSFTTSPYHVLANAALNFTPASVDTEETGKPVVWWGQRSLTHRGSPPFGETSEPMVTHGLRSCEVKGNVQSEFEHGIFQIGLEEIFVFIDECKPRVQQGFTVKGYPVPELGIKPSDQFIEGGVKKVVNRNFEVTPWDVSLFKQELPSIDLFVRKVESPDCFFFTAGAKNTVADSTRKVAVAGVPCLLTSMLDVRNELLAPPWLMQLFLWPPGYPELDFPSLTEFGETEVKAPGVFFSDRSPFTEIDEPVVQANNIKNHNHIDFFKRSIHMVTHANREVAPAGAPDDCRGVRDPEIHCMLCGPLEDLSPGHVISPRFLVIEESCDSFNMETGSPTSSKYCSDYFNYVSKIEHFHRICKGQETGSTQLQTERPKLSLGINKVEPNADTLTNYGWFGIIPRTQRVWSAGGDDLLVSEEHDTWREHVSFDITVSPSSVSGLLFGAWEIQNQHREVVPDSGITFLWGDNNPMVHFEREVIPEPTDTDQHFQMNRLSHDPQYPQINEGPLLEETRWESAPWVFSFWREGMIYPFSAETEKYGRPDVRRAA
jgi:hypothetical protein